MFFLGGGLERHTAKKKPEKTCQIRAASCRLLLRTVTEEFLVYDLPGFAGDVGGVVGILLGTSVLALYDHVHQLVRYLRGSRVSGREEDRTREAETTPQDST